MLVSVILWLFAALAVLAVVPVGRSLLVTRRLAAEAERKCPPAGRFIEVDGNRIHYVDIGEGRPIVFLHGLVRSFAISPGRCLANSAPATG